MKLIKRFERENINENRFAKKRAGVFAPLITLGFEDEDTENYMFFANIENISRMCKEILKMDKHKVDEILSDGHAWAVDHISTSKDDVEEVFNFLNTHSHDSEENLIGGPKASYPMPVDSEPSFDETEGQLANKDLESEIKSFKNFKDIGPEVKKVKPYITKYK